MKKFVFSMQKILELRQFEQKQAEAELGKANAEVARIQRELDSIANRKVQATRQFDGDGDIFVQNQMQSFLFMLNQKAEKFLEEMAQAQIVADEKRSVVREAMQKTKVLEKLREAKLRQWNEEALREEDNDIDDIVSSRYGHPESRT